MNVEIRSRLTGKVILSLETDSIKSCVEEAVRFKISLSDANLSSVNLAGACLVGADLAYASLANAILTGSDLTGANLRETNLIRANLVGASLRFANLSKAKLSGADLHQADASNADFTGVEMSGTRATSAKLVGTNFRNANLADTDLSWSDLSYADLSKSNLAGANLRETNLLGVYLSDARLARAKNFSKYLTTPLYAMHDQPGAIRAYKLVNRDYEGTVVGGIVYEIGKTYSEPNADTDETEPCGRGIHLATLDWCLKQKRSSDKILIAEFTAADIAAIPIGSDGKFRVKKCTIVGEKRVEVD